MPVWNSSEECSAWPPGQTDRQTDRGLCPRWDPHNQRGVSQLGLCCTNVSAPLTSPTPQMLWLMLAPRSESSKDQSFMNPCPYKPQSTVTKTRRLLKSRATDSWSQTALILGVVEDQGLEAPWRLPGVTGTPSKYPELHWEGRCQHGSDVGTLGKHPQQPNHPPWKTNCSPFL